MTETTGSAADGAARETRVFLSYSRKDMGFAEKLDRALEARGYGVLIDRADIAPGEDWKARLGGLIVAADAVVFAVSPASARSEICGWEVAEAQRLGKRVLPVVAKRVDEKTLPPDLARLNFIGFARRDFGKALDALVQALDTDLDWVREHTHLAGLAQLWEQGGGGGARVLRGKALVEAERWIAGAPRNAAPGELHRAFIAASRKAAGGRQRNWTLGALAVALVSIGLSVWGEINRREAVAQRDRAERVLKAAAGTANALVFELAQQFRDVQGVPVATIRKVLDKARGLQSQLGEAGEMTPTMRRDEAAGLTELSDTFLKQGDTQAALGASTQAAAIMQDLAAREAGDAARQYDLSVSLSRLADVQVARGELGGALANYRRSQEIFAALAKAVPGNARYRRDLSVSLYRTGDVQAAQGDREGALASFRESLALAEALASAQPGDNGLKRDLSVSLEKVGDMLAARGDAAEALTHYRASLAIREKLAAGDPGNARWRRDLAASRIKTGDTLVALKRPGEALADYRASLAIFETLAAGDPGNTGWQRDLAIVLGKTGDAQAAAGDRAAALDSHARSLATRAALAARDPGNAMWQRDVAAGHWQLAAAGEAPRENYGKALAILKRLKAEGRLAAADEKYIAEAEGLIAKLPAQ